ncbi:hypothetical protein BJV82DRAFT_715697 [Fennellomyces sp. T-0311]|nr:hypothetical protein BJV82DRAFT_715697 [Fennellomyces sp. T-0311]
MEETSFATSFRSLLTQPQHSICVKMPPTRLSNGTSDYAIPDAHAPDDQKHLDNQDATMIRCPTTSSTSSPQSDDYNDNSSDNLSTDSLSADSCDSFCTTQQYPSSESKELDSDTPVTLDRLHHDNLSVQVLTLFEKLLPTRDSHERRMGLVRKIERLLNAEWTNRDIRVHLFGSSVNDLGTSQSDVDLCITTPWNGLRNVRILAKLFRRCGMQHVVCVPRAKVPIVRLFDPESQLAGDMNVNNTLALQNTEMIKTYVALDPRVRPFIMTIKHWTKQRRLNDAANGGTLSSYTWTCMAINFLQMRVPPILPVLHQLTDEKDGESFCTDVDRLRGFGSVNCEGLGGLLYAFFRRFAHEFDYEDQVVSVRTGRYLTKAEKEWNVGRYQHSFCVEEPFNISRNLGNSADQASVQGLLVEFRRACHLLAAGASLDLVCEQYQPPTMRLEESDSTSPVDSSPLLPLPTTSPAPTNTRRMTHPSLPPVVLPVHPHAIDSSLHPHDRHRSPENMFVYSPSVPNASTADLRYLQPHDAPSRPRFNSASTHASMPTPAARSMRHSSHPFPCCTTGPIPGLTPYPITIALPRPTASSYVSTLHHHPKKSNSGVDSILARYSNKQRGSMDHSNGHRRSSVASSKGSRRVSRNSSIDWPSISPTSSATLEMTRQQQQQNNNNRRRRWSTVKHSSDTPKKTMADVVKEQHQERPQQPQQAQQQRSRHRQSSKPSGSSSTNNGRQRKKNNAKSRH